MLLGKRPRPPMRRTTSMSGGVNNLDNESPRYNTPTTILHLHNEGVYDAVPLLGGHNHDHHIHDMNQNMLDHMVVSTHNTNIARMNQNYQNITIPHTLTPTSTPVVVDTTPHFLRTCGLCKSHLPSGRDIFMYRGDTAFCSLECREQRMKEDSRKQKWFKLTASNKEDYHHPPPSTAAAATAEASTKTKAAACT